MTTSSPYLAVGIGCLAAFFLGTAASAAPYTLTVLPTLNGYTSSYAQGINDLGQVVGLSEVQIGLVATQRGWIWDSTNGIQDIGDLPGGADDSPALGINNSGQVVGGSNQHAYLWDSVGGIQDMDPSNPAQFSSATNINALGQVSGIFQPGGNLHAFVWDAVNGFTDLGDLPGGNNLSVANDINDSGTVVGYSSVAGAGQPNRAFRWNAADGMQSLGTLPGHISSLAYGINGTGTIVGASLNNSPFGRAFVWDQANGMQDLGELPGGLDASQALDINDAGQVVGYSASSQPGFHATLWQPGVGILDLNTLIDPTSFILRTAAGINESGQIVGYGVFGGSDATPYAFLLTPDDPLPSGGGSSAPAPGAMALLGLGMFGMAFVRRRIG